VYIRWRSAILGLDGVRSRLIPGPSFSPTLDSRLVASLASSLREALASGCNYIGPEHLLLAVLAQGTDEVVAVLAAAGADAATVRTQVRRLSANPPGWDPSALSAAALVSRHFPEPA
jgi:ATP-dependent Clp protease ATP-binding subunit ClpA